MNKTYIMAYVYVLAFRPCHYVFCWEIEVLKCVILYSIHRSPARGAADSVVSYVSYWLNFIKNKDPSYSFHWTCLALLYTQKLVMPALHRREEGE